MGQTFDYMQVQGAHLPPSERDLIRYISEEIEHRFGPDSSIVHIGVEHGGSLYCSREGAPNSDIVGIDLIGDGWLTNSSSPEQVEELGAAIIEGDSRVVHKLYNRPIHFLFVDGDHKYKVVREDIKNWGPKIVPGGVIAFHDALLGSYKHWVSRAINEVLTDGWEEQESVLSIRWFRRNNDKRVW